MSTDDESSEGEDESPGMLANFMTKEKKKRAQLTDFDGFDDGDDNTVVRKMKGILALRESLGMDDDKSFMAEQERKAAERKKLASMTVEERMRYEEEQAGDVMSKIRARHVEKLKEADAAPPAPAPRAKAPPMPGLKPLAQAPPMPGLKPLAQAPPMPGLKPIKKKTGEPGDRKIRRVKSDDGLLGGAPEKPRRSRRASISGSMPAQRVEADEQKERKRMARRGSTGARPTSMAEMERETRVKSERRTVKSSSGKKPLKSEKSTRKVSADGEKPRKMKSEKSSRKMADGEKPRKKAAAL